MTLEELEQGKLASLAEIAAASDAEAVEKLRVKYVGRNGSIPALIKGMKDVPKEERPAFGKAVQAWRAEVESALAAKGAGARAAGPAEAVDATLPGRWGEPGVEHPLSRVIADAARIFGKLGFTVADGPDIETPFNNFTALNTPPHHPSQDRSDTFWLTDDQLLRTQTSPVQIRTMLAAKQPPVRVICPGRTYRRDTTDATHSANFHQIEGLYVDTKPVSLADLKSVLAYFANEMMGNLPVHRAVRGSGLHLPRLQGQGLRGVQAVRLDRDRRRGHGRSARVPSCGLGSRNRERLRLRLRRGAHRDDQVRHSRYPLALRERPPFPQADGVARGTAFWYNGCD